MDATELKAIIEAMIFVSQEPLTENAIHIALAEDGIEKDAVRECIANIEKDWSESADRGVGLAKVAGGYQFRTKESCASWLKKLTIPKPMRLSAQALETLAIVAYRQPIMRSEIEKIRGVDTGGVLKTLLERRLLRIVGRSQEPGQPLLYGTTKEFLEVFNLNTLKELPTLKDIDDLMRERREQIQGDAQIKAEGDDEDLTEILGEKDKEEEDETEIIRRRPLDEDEEEEKKDQEALSTLETQLKGLRRLEKAMFPKPIPKPQAEDATSAESQTEADKAQTQGEGAHTSACDEGANEDSPSEDDRPFQ
ncbi:MAG: SMC-Scp complex subunit ScpB [Pseudomonadota bacterium]